jgi:hypothetical protein
MGIFDKAKTEAENEQQNMGQQGGMQGGQQGGMQAARDTISRQGGGQVLLVETPWLQVPSPAPLVSRGTVSVVGTPSSVVGDSVFRMQLRPVPRPSHPQRQHHGLRGPPEIG